MLSKELGLEAQHVDQATTQECSRAWFTMATAELAQSLAEHRDRWGEFEPSLRLMVEIGAEIPTFDYLEATRSRWAECARVDALLGDDGVLLTPTVNATAWPPEGPLPTNVAGIDDSWIAVNTPDFNFTGHPAVNVPLGRDTDNVPFGLQIVAPRCRDGLAFGVAQVWERVSPWPETAPGYDPFGF
jgi:Asp-tRNA(Asn)/Glu-tRNA(Gln) amidotransferase A subunit family amidase